MTTTMTEHQEPTDTGTGGASFRSRASSVISTGTKFSISTIPPEPHNIDNIIQGHAARLAARPGSIYSFRSVEHTLPAYREEEPPDAQYIDDEPLNIPPVNTDTADSDHPPAENEPPTPSTADPENALSMHYGRVVRTIDENHARQLARIKEGHEQELAATRHAIDAAYRKEFKAKDREVERVREQTAREVEHVRGETAATVAGLEAQIRALGVAHEEELAEAKSEREDEMARLREEYEAEGRRVREMMEKEVARERNKVEDLWEGRWNDRIRLAAEEAARCRDEGREKLESAVRERDEQWLRLIGVKCPSLLDELRGAMTGFGDEVSVGVWEKHG